MDSKILQLMESADPQDRKKAVKMLAQVGGPEAIRALGMIYKQDSDPEVKELAIQAGKYIKKQQTQADAAPVPQPSYRAPVVEEEIEDDEPIEEEEEDFQPVVVPASKQEQAKGLMDRALDLSMHSEKDKAIESLAKAFKLNPNLRLDSYYMGVAMDITGLDQKTTLRLVTADEKTRKAQNKEKAKNDGTGGNEEVTWDTALIDLTMYFVVASAVMIVGMILVVQAFTAALTTMQACGCNSASITNTLSFLGSLRGTGAAILVLYGLVIGLLITISLLIQYAGIHFISTMVLGGDGTYPGLIHRATTPLTVMMGVTGIFVIVSLYLALQPLSDKALMQNYLATGQEPAASPIGAVLGLVNFVVSIGGFFWFTSRVGQNYDFGSGRGCVAVILTSILLSILSFGCSFIATSTILSNAMTR